MTSWKMMQMKRKYSAVQVTGLHLLVTVHFSFCCFWPTNGSNISKKEDWLCTLIKTIWSIQSQIFKTRNTDQAYVGTLGIDTMMNHNNPTWTAVCLTWWYTTRPPGRQSIVTWFWRVRRFQTLHCRFSKICLWAKWYCIMVIWLDSGSRSRHLMPCSLASVPSAGVSSVTPEKQTQMCEIYMHTFCLFYRLGTYSSSYDSNWAVQTGILLFEMCTKITSLCVSTVIEDIYCGCVYSYTRYVLWL